MDERTTERAARGSHPRLTAVRGAFGSWDLYSEQTGERLSAYRWTRRLATRHGLSWDEAREHVAEAVARGREVQ